MTVWIASTSQILVLEAQILDIAFSAVVEKCRSKTFSILSTTGLPFVPSPFHHSSSVIYFMFINVKGVVSSFHPSCIYDHSPVESFTHYVWDMYNAYELFIPVDASGNLFYVIYSMLAWLGCHVMCCVDTHLIIGYMCKLDMDMCIVWIIDVYLVPYFYIALANFDAC